MTPVDSLPLKSPKTESEPIVDTNSVQLAGSNKTKKKIKNKKLKTKRSKKILKKKRGGSNYEDEILNEVIDLNNPGDVQETLRNEIDKIAKIQDEIETVMTVMERLDNLLQALRIKTDNADYLLDRL